MNKKEAIKAIRQLKKNIKKKKHDTIFCTTFWDIHEKSYKDAEIAARLLRRRGYNITIGVKRLEPLWLSYFYGHLRYRRYLTIKY